MLHRSVGDIIVWAVAAEMVGFHPFWSVKVREKEEHQVLTLISTAPVSCWEPEDVVAALLAMRATRIACSCTYLEELQ